MLGAGGFGITYLAFDHQLDGPVAVKEYFPADSAARDDGLSVRATSSMKQDVFAWGLHRFLDEARAVHRFRHPNVVRGHRFLEAHGTAYFVMEYVEGESLKAILDRRGSLPAEEWRRWLDALLKGLAHVHAHDYLHRDIKPANIVVRAEDGEPVLIDFGSARIQHGERTHTQVLTAGYAPIEQYSTGAEQGPPTDIYALAAVSYRVLTGDEVPSAPDRMISDAYEPLAERRTGADRPWLAAIDYGLRLRPGDRPEDLEAWRAALGEDQAATSALSASLPELSKAGGGLQQLEAPESTPHYDDHHRNGREKPPYRRMRRHLWWAVPALFNLLVLGLRIANGPPGEAVSALDHRLPPHRGTVSLGEGIGPQLSETAVLAGGAVDASYLGDDCVGYASESPDLRLDWSGLTESLLFYFVADDDTDDPTLIVRTPNGRWLCNDDSPGDILGLNPGFSLGVTPEGQYDIWVGTRHPTSTLVSGNLFIGYEEDAADGPARLDASLSPHFGTVRLRAGFTPHPNVTEVEAGGPIDASYLGGDCVGFASESPDLRLHWSGSAKSLIVVFAANDDTDDATLIVNMPDGSWLCNDDGPATSLGLNPRIALEAPPEGQYDIWVGAFTEGLPHIPGRLAIGEKRIHRSATGLPAASSGGAGRRSATGPRQRGVAPPAGERSGSREGAPTDVAPSRSGGGTTDPTTPTTHAEARQESSNGRATATTFTRGSHQDDVLHLQGTPTGIQRYEALGRETWSYGLSRVTISTRTRTVLDWSNHGGQLKVSLLPGNNATDATTFTRGSHQDDVLRLQGTPTGIQRYEALGRETWSYGLSRVTISTRTRTVLDWSNHGGQLKVSLLPGNNATDATTFTRGSHQDDVLRLQGTPTDIQRYEALGRETWSYGLSSVTISARTRTVLDWSNHGGQLKVSLLPGNNATDATTLTRGSHQDDVLRLQGTPTDIQHYEALGRETWSYGLSSVTISTRTRTVLDWSNHGGQLKVRLAARE